MPTQGQARVNEWLEQLRKGMGLPAEIRIRDTAGKDPASPPKLFQLYDVRISADELHLVCYLNEAQHVSIPINESSRLVPLEGGGQLRFQSKDEQAELVYELTVKYV